MLMPGNFWMVIDNLASRMPVLLAGSLRTLAPDIVVALLRQLPPATCPITDVIAAQRELAGFINGHRTLDATLPRLAALVHGSLGYGLRQGRIRVRDAALLVAVAGQLRPVTEVVALFRQRGRDALLSDMRRIVGQITR